MIEKIKNLVLNERFCVLATSMENHPYCSLMAYASRNDCRRIYMVSQRDSVKYTNLLSNSSVSLLIDTRGGSNESGIKMSALTITGSFNEIKDVQELKQAGNLLIERHPDLNVFLEDASASVFAVDVKSFLLLNGFTDRYFEEL
jgi:nitroimidazol reductase NimA-like FMN-containing flavoprotein (pyridoxamine 5'-phosphate oxidase superfamily)